MSRTIFIFGDSHTKAIDQYFKEKVDGAHNNTYIVNYLQTEKNGNIQGDLTVDGALDLIDSLATGDLVVLSFLGTLHNILGLVKHESPFTFNYERAETASEELIPVAALRATFLEKMTQNKPIRQIIKRAKCRVLILSTPPPKQSNEYIASKMSRYREHSVSIVSLNDPGNRLAMWNIEMDALERFCESNNITRLPTPEETINEFGFLSEECFQNDVTHANAFYGKKVIEMLEEINL
jgi:hypothetical protein